MRKLAKLIDQFNLELYNPRGLNILWPRKAAFMFVRTLEISSSTSFCDGWLFDIYFGQLEIEYYVSRALVWCYAITNLLPCSTSDPLGLALSSSSTTITYISSLFIYPLCTILSPIFFLFSFLSLSFSPFLLRRTYEERCVCTYIYPLWNS